MVKPIREHAGKNLLEKHLPEVSGGKRKMGCDFGYVYSLAPVASSSLLYVSSSLGTCAAGAYHRDLLRLGLVLGEIGLLS